MTTWADIKLAALKKMDPSIKSLTVQNSTRDYLNSIVPAANRGLQDLATAGKFIIKEYDIMTCDVTNLLGQDFTTHQHLNDDIEFTSEYGQAFYFEISGRAKVDIYVGEQHYKDAAKIITEAYPDAYWHSDIRGGIHYILVLDELLDRVVELHRVTMEFSNPRANQLFQNFGVDVVVLGNENLDSFQSIFRNVLHDF